MENHLIERLHLVGSSFSGSVPWVYYELLGVALGDFPDNGESVVIQVVNAIREEFGLGLPEAYAIWKNRTLELDA